MTSPVPNEFRCDGRFYALFNLPSNATEDDIRRAPPLHKSLHAERNGFITRLYRAAYKRVAMGVHPDRHANGNKLCCRLYLRRRDNRGIGRHLQEDRYACGLGPLLRRWICLHSAGRRRCRRRGLLHQRDGGLA